MVDYLRSQPDPVKPTPAPTAITPLRSISVIRTPPAPARVERHEPIEKRAPRIEPKPAPPMEVREPPLEREPEEKEKPPELKELEIDKKMVDQRLDTDEPEPKNARYLSQVNHRAFEETRPRETSLTHSETVEREAEKNALKEKKPGKKERKLDRKKKTNVEKRRDEPRKEVPKFKEMAPKSALAPSKPRPTSAREDSRISDVSPQPLKNLRERRKQRKDEPKPAAEPTPLEETGDQPALSEEQVQDLFTVDPENYQAVFGAADEQYLAEHPQPASEEETSMVGSYDDTWVKTRASLENYIPEVRPGNQLDLTTQKSEYAVYITAIHRRIHPRWGSGFLIFLDLHYGDPTDELNDPKLKAVMEFRIDGDTGEVDRVAIVRSSGNTVYDAEAIRILYDIGPLPTPPPGMVSPNGKVYIHWTFWRNQRQCGTFGASLFIIDTKLLANH